jgi:hypothetical protein
VIQNNSKKHQLLSCIGQNSQVVQSWQLLYLAPDIKTFLTAVAGGKMRKSPRSSVTDVSSSAFSGGVGTDVISYLSPEIPVCFLIISEEKTSLTMYLIK